MQHLVPNVDHVIDLGEISQVRVGSEVIAQVNFGLLGSGPVLTASYADYISWILRR